MRKRHTRRCQQKLSREEGDIIFNAIDSSDSVRQFLCVCVSVNQTDEVRKAITSHAFAVAGKLELVVLMKAGIE